MAELFGRVDGCAHGRGGSMHLLDASVGYYGGWGIVAGQLPIATGLGLGLVRQKRAERRALRARRRRDQHGRVARVAEPRCGVAAAGRLPRDEQRVRDGDQRRARLRRSPALPPRRRLRAAGGARRRRRPARRRAGGRDDAERGARGAPGRRARARHLPLPRPFGRRRRPRLPHARRARRAPAPRPDLPRPRAARRRGRGRRRARRDARDGRTRAWRRRSRRRSPSPPPAVSSLATGMYAPGSAAQFARMLPGAPFGERELVFAGGLGE